MEETKLLLISNGGLTVLESLLAFAILLLRFNVTTSSLRGTVDWISKVIVEDCEGIACSMRSCRVNGMEHDAH